jgi:hypothetical protein
MSRRRRARVQTTFGLKRAGNAAVDAAERVDGGVRDRQGCAGSAEGKDRPSASCSA